MIILQDFLRALVYHSKENQTDFTENWEHAHICGNLGKDSLPMFWKYGIFWVSQFLSL